MKKEKIIKLINSRLIDVRMFYEYYNSHPKRKSNMSIEDFNMFFNAYYSGCSIIEIYKVFMIDCNINSVSDENGVLIKVY